MVLSTAYVLANIIPQVISASKISDHVGAVTQGRRGGGEVNSDIVEIPNLDTEVFHCITLFGIFTFVFFLWFLLLLSIMM
jgi:hypothetical protein